jgi:membrane-associated protein
MHATLQALPLIPTPQSILDHFGGYALWAALVIVFIECGLFVFFMPGDSLLFTVGLLIAHGTNVGAPIWLACILLTASAVASNVVGYLLGRRLGLALFKPDARLLKTEYLDKTHDFFERYGNRAILLARFVPIVRTFITVLAGASRMDMRRFVTYSAVGGVLWATGVTLLGYWLGHVSFVRTHIELMLVLLVALSLVPIGIEYLRHRRTGSPGSGSSSVTHATD